MEKMIALSAIVLLLLTGTSAFAETAASNKVNDGFSNGITYFSNTSPALCFNRMAVKTATSGPAAALSNGITYFDQDVQGVGTTNECSFGFGLGDDAAWLKNGITIFS